MVYSLLKSNNLSTCKNYKNRVFYADPWPNPAKIFDPVTWRPGSNTESNDKLWCRLWQRSSVWSSAVLRLLPRSDVQCMDRWTTPVDSGQLSGCIVRAIYHNYTQHAPRAGSGVERIDPLRFLAGNRTRRLNQALSVLS